MGSSSEGSIKVNVDAVVTSTTSALAVVARDHHGKVWMKKYCLCSPIQAEAAALLWAAQLASLEGWKHVILEGYSKVCIDSLSEPNVLPVWSISNIIRNILTVKESFFSCLVSWVRRSSNSAVHAAALRSNVSLCFNKDSLPFELVSACMADFPFAVPLV